MKSINAMIGNEFFTGWGLTWCSHGNPRTYRSLKAAQAFYDPPINRDMEIPLQSVHLGIYCRD